MTKTISNLLSAAQLATILLATGAIADADEPGNRPSGTVQQLQWSAVDVDAAQFKGVRDLAVNALGMRPVVDQPYFVVLVAANGSFFEIYGPGSSDRPWRHGQGGVAVGFLSADIVATEKAIQMSGGVLVGALNVIPKAGAMVVIMLSASSGLQTTASTPLSKTRAITPIDCWEEGLPKESPEYHPEWTGNRTFGNKPKSSPP